MMMMKALIRKQFGECFSNYYIDRKTGKPCPKGKVTARFIGFAVLCAFLCVMFSLQAIALGQMLRPETSEALQGITRQNFDPVRLYFTLLAIMSILMGTFGSVFNTYAGMYLAKDNDLLLSMPIPPRRILFARLIGVYGLALLYSGMIWLPACVIYWFLAPSHTAPAAEAAFQFLLLFIIPFFVSVLTCLLGWVVALISGRLKNKSYVTVIISLVLFGLYYFVCFKFSDFIQDLLNNSAAVDEGLNKWVKFLCLIGEGAGGNILSFLIFAGVTAVLCFITFTILSRSFNHIALRVAPAGTSAKKLTKEYSKGEQAGAKSIRMALYSREMKRFTSSATYMLNCGLSLVLLPVIAVVLLVKADSITPLFRDVLPLMSPLLKDIVCPAALLLTGFMASMNYISTPSVSLEGKNLWILRSLPVTGKQILQAKLMLHMSMGTLPVCFSVLMLGITLKCSALQCALMVIIAFLFTAYSGLLGLIIGVKRPDFNWTNETYPIKQSSNVLLALLTGWCAGLIVPGLCWAGGLIMDPTLAMGIVTVLLAGVCLLLLRVMNTKTAEQFDRL